MAAEKQQSVKPGSGGSMFAVTCGLLRQYMKEQGGGGTGARFPPAMAASLVPGADVVGGPAPKEGRRTVLDLFPQQPGTLKKGASQERSKEQERTAPLTMFYGGRMVVFDDFPAGKAEELMKVAGSCNAVSPAAAAGAGQPCLPDMPVARKVSLQRFLSKRKNRLTTAGPDPAAASESASKRVKDEAAPYLSVNSTLSLS